MMCEMKIRRRFRHKIIGEADVLSSEFCSYCHSSVCVFLGKRNETLSQLVRLASSKAAQRFHKKAPPREQACVWRRIPDPGGGDFGILGLVLLVRRDEVGIASRARADLGCAESRMLIPESR